MCVCVCVLLSFSVFSRAPQDFYAIYFRVQRERERRVNVCRCGGAVAIERDEI